MANFCILPLLHSVRDVWDSDMTYYVTFLETFSMHVIQKLHSSGLRILYTTV